jgi:hypothetical protein
VTTGAAVAVSATGLPASTACTPGEVVRVGAGRVHLDGVLPLLQHDGGDRPHEPRRTGQLGQDERGLGDGVARLLGAHPAAAAGSGSSAGSGQPRRPWRRAQQRGRGRSRGVSGGQRYHRATSRARARTGLEWTHTPVGRTPRRLEWCARLTVAGLPASLGTASAATTGAALACASATSAAGSLDQVMPPPAHRWTGRRRPDGADREAEVEPAGPQQPERAHRRAPADGLEVGEQPAGGVLGRARSPSPPGSSARRTSSVPRAGQQPPPPSSRPATARTSRQGVQLLHLDRPGDGDRARSLRSRSTIMTCSARSLVLARRTASEPGRDRQRPLDRTVVTRSPTTAPAARAGAADRPSPSPASTPPYTAPGRPATAAARAAGSRRVRCAAVPDDVGLVDVAAGDRRPDALDGARVVGVGPRRRPGPDRAGPGAAATARRRAGRRRRPARARPGTGLRGPAGHPADAGAARRRRAAGRRRAPACAAARAPGRARQEGGRAARPGRPGRPRATPTGRPRCAGQPRRVVPQADCAP